MGTGSATAVDQDVMRDLVELNLIESYHWTPEYISTLPYKWIQKHNHMKRMKNIAVDTKSQVQQAKSQSRPMRPGEKRQI
jgi:hypothetical protein